MIPPEIVFLTPHLVERMTARPEDVQAPALNEANGNPTAPLARRRLTAFVGAVRFARIPLLVGLVVALVAWGTPGATIAIAVVALVLLLGVALNTREILRGEPGSGTTYATTASPRVSTSATSALSPMVTQSVRTRSHS